MEEKCPLSQGTDAGTLEDQATNSMCCRFKCVEGQCGGELKGL